MATEKLQAGLATEPQSLARGCEAYDLKRILTTIADQISDADQRHTEALQVMQQRLAALGGEAKAMRERAPEEIAPAIARIEDRMASLSEKISEADDTRRAAMAAGVAPAALRSTGDGMGSFTTRKDGGGAAEKPSVDPFDVVGLDGASCDPEPWDAASAEALAKLYEGGDAALGEPDPQYVVVPPVAAVVAAPTQMPAAAQSGPALSLVSPVAPVSTSVPLHQDERVWLEDRFAQVALKLEQSLAGMRPDGSVMELSSRFGMLEERLGTVMGQTVTRADLNGLKTIEHQVEDLTARLDTVQTHFSRLDTIELELRALAEHITEDNLTRVFKRAMPQPAERTAAHKLDDERMPRIESALQVLAEKLSDDKFNRAMAVPAAQPDPGVLAAIVAAKLAEHLPKAGQSNADGIERIDDLRVLLNGFIDEQRHGDEQTNTMLDTMQQAMIRLLDRMDAIETGAPVHQAPLNEPLQVPMRSAAPAASPAPQHDRMAPLHDQRDVPGLSTAFASTETERGYAPQTQVPESYQVPKSEKIQEPVARAPSEMSQAPDPSNLNKDDFVAAARRAARQATQKAAAESGVDSPETFTMVQATTPITKPVPRPGAKPSKSSAPKAVVGASAKKGRQPSMVTLALISLITVGVTFMLAKPYLLAAAKHSLDPSGIELKAPPVAAPKASTSKTPNLDLNSNDEIIEGTTGKAGAAPGQAKKSSFLIPSEGMEEDATEAPAPLAAFIPAALPVEGTGTTGRIDEAAVPQRGFVEMPPITIGPNSLRVSAAKGDPSAQFEVGARYAEGKGVQQDLKQAVVWYQRSASQGFAAAQYRLASMFERGLGTKADFATAMSWYRRAAEQGNVKAMHNLAVLNAGREGLTADYTAAARWFTSASEHGVTDSQFNLAIMLESGLGVEKDPRLAYKWFALAARAGDAEASKRRDALRAKLAPTALKDTDAEIEAWRAKQSEPSINDIRVAGEAWKNKVN